MTLTSNTQAGVVGQLVDMVDGGGNTVKRLLPSVQIGGATYQLLTNVAVTGAAVTGIAGGEYLWAVAGTFGGATVKLQYLGPDGTTYIDVPSASLTAVGAVLVRIGANASVKAVVTGGTPSGLYSNLS